MADIGQATIGVLRTRFRVGGASSRVVAVAGAGPVLATVDPADIRGLVTTRLWNVAELLRSRLECSAHHTTHNVNEDSPDRGRASATTHDCFVSAGSARSRVGYEVKQALLLHANEINADYFDQLVRMMKRRGYKFITLEQALRDKAYRLPDAQSSEGISWLHRWALAKGMKLREEPREPGFITALFKASQ